MTRSFIVDGARTPIGKFRGGLAPLRAVDLGGAAIREFRIVAVEIFDPSESAIFRKNSVFGNIDAQRVGTVGFLN